MRHGWKTSPHVSNNVNNCPAVVFEPLVISYDRKKIDGAIRYVEENILNILEVILALVDES